MADFSQFGSARTRSKGVDPQQCAHVEAMLTDALDGTLSPADQTTFDTHMMGCVACSEMFADAGRGAAWMEMLRTPRPEPPADLLERILAQTSVPAAAAARNHAASEIYPPIVLGSTDRLRTPEAAASPNTLLGGPMLTRDYTPAGAFPGKILPFRTRVSYGLRSLGHTMLQPRLAMTAAMAFFSIALTLNLTGVRVSQLRAGDFKPSSILRGCYEAKAKVVRYSENLRVVYELESRVRDLQHSSDDGGQIPVSQAPVPQKAPAAQPGQKPSSQQPDGSNPDQKQSRPRPNPGSSRRESPSGSIRQVDYSRQPYSLPAACKDFVVFIPSGYKQEGGLV